MSKSPPVGKGTAVAEHPRVRKRQPTHSEVILARIRTVVISPSASVRRNCRSDWLCVKGAAPEDPTDPLSRRKAPATNAAVTSQKLTEDLTPHRENRPAQPRRSDCQAR